MPFNQILVHFVFIPTLGASPFYKEWTGQDEPGAKA